MPEHRWNDMELDEQTEALSDYLDQMEEEEFDPAIVDRWPGCHGGPGAGGIRV